MMKKIEILQELPKRDKNEQMLFENGAERLI